MSPCTVGVRIFVHRGRHLLADIVQERDIGPEIGLQSGSIVVTGDARARHLEETGASAVQALAGEAHSMVLQISLFLGELPGMCQMCRYWYWRSLTGKLQRLHLLSSLTKAAATSSIT